MSVPKIVTPNPAAAVLSTRCHCGPQHRRFHASCTHPGVDRCEENDIQCVRRRRFRLFKSRAPELVGLSCERRWLFFLAQNLARTRSRAARLRWMLSAFCGDKKWCCTWVLSPRVSVKPRPKCMGNRGGEYFDHSGVGCE